MSRPPLAKLATDLLAAERVHVEAPSPAEEARALAALADAVQRNARARRVRRAAFAGAAIAACLSLLIAWNATHRTPARPQAANAPTVAGTIDGRVRALADGVVVLRDGRELDANRGVEILTKDRMLTANDGRASLAFATGTHLVLEGGSNLSVSEQTATRAFSLRAGTMRADVAKLGAGERFIVRTSDTEVEVRGTSFRVSVVSQPVACARTTTRVTVDEGVVAVRYEGREDLVRAHETWPPECAAATTATERGPVEPPPAPAVAVGLPDAIPQRPVGTVAHPASSHDREAPASAMGSAPARDSTSALGAQNALFAEATAARRRGDTRGAIARFEELSARYPSGPLAETARVERMRLLATTEPGRGADAAREYLRAYPRGFAREEATRLAGAQP